MFGLGLLKGTAIGLTGGIVIGLVIKEAIKQLNNRRNQSVSTAPTDNNKNSAEENLS